jgi:cytochrome oxidase Cu insertion factor (SCO1/SenC/PrrC family)
MIYQKKRLQLGHLVLGFVLLLWFSTGVFGQYAVGDHVSNFTLKDVDGNNVSLYNYSGKVVVLNFFSMT